jgi:hypothetical protein
MMASINQQNDFGSFEKLIIAIEVAVFWCKCFAQRECPTHVCLKMASTYGKFNRGNDGKPWNPLFSDKAKVQVY